MIPFNEADPFPLLKDGQHTYAEAQVHAQAVDSWLGLKTEEIEAQLTKEGCGQRAPGSSGERQELWIGLAPQRLLTPYTEIRSILEKLNLTSGHVVVDLGAGYGRMGMVMGRHYPQVKFIGYEYVGERVREGRRILASYPNVSLEHADLMAPDFSLADAQVYFIYDYGTPKAIEKTLHDLRRKATKRMITVVGRGRGSRDAIEKRHPWLSDVVKPLHWENYSIYRSGT